MFPRPLITYAIIALNVFVFVTMFVMGASPLDPNAYTLYQWGGFFGPAVTDDGQWWRFISSLFIHGGLLHLFVNCYSLYNVGPSLEFLIGKRSYFALYLLSGIIAGFFVLFFTPKTVAVGASGAIFGIFTSEIGLLIKYRKFVSSTFYKKSIRSFLIVLALNLGLGFSISGISNAAHIGGALCGFLLIFLPPFTTIFEKRKMFLYFN